MLRLYTVVGMREQSRGIREKSREESEEEESCVDEAWIRVPGTRTGKETFSKASCECEWIEVL